MAFRQGSRRHCVGIKWNEAAVTRAVNVLMTMNMADSKLRRTKH
jgi:hypothetical protein